MLRAHQQDVEDGLFLLRLSSHGFAELVRVSCVWYFFAQQLHSDSLEACRKHLVTSSKFAADYQPLQTCHVRHQVFEVKQEDL